MELSIFPLVMSISSVMDWMNPTVSGHQKRVCFISAQIGKAMGLSGARLRDLSIASLLHDIGAFSLKEWQEAMQFEFNSPHDHAQSSYLLLRMVPSFSGVASQVLFHHLPWNRSHVEISGEKVMVESHIIHLSDRVEILIQKSRNVLSQIHGIRSVIHEEMGEKFAPEVVEAFMDIGRKESFWLDIVNPQTVSLLSEDLRFFEENLDWDELMRFCEMIGYFIDFRSRFTAVHTGGVSACSHHLARKMGFDDKASERMRLAGLLHDIGKLAIPLEILEKEASLTDQEMNVIKTHSYYTHSALRRIPQIADIADWACSHHEKLNGNGYPFKKSQDEMDLGCRIVACADIFTALMEDRPYRKGMSQKESLDLMTQMVKAGDIDNEVVETLIRHSEALNAIRQTTQEKERQNYLQFQIDLHQLREEMKKRLDS